MVRSCIGVPWDRWKDDRSAPLPAQSRTSAGQGGAASGSDQVCSRGSAERRALSPAELHLTWGRAGGDPGLQGGVQEVTGGGSTAT